MRRVSSCHKKSCDRGSSLRFEMTCPFERNETSHAVAQKCAGHVEKWSEPISHRIHDGRDRRQRSLARAGQPAGKFYGENVNGLREPCLPLLIYRTSPPRVREAE